MLPGTCPSPSRATTRSVACGATLRQIRLGLKENSVAGGTAAHDGRSPPLEISVRTADIAEAAAWVRGVERAGPRQIVITGQDLLSVYRSFCAAILLTRAIAEAV